MAKNITDEEYELFCKWRDENRRKTLIESIGKKRTRRGREVTLNEVLTGISLDTLARVEQEFNPMVETREPEGNEGVTINVRPQAQRVWETVAPADHINEFIATLPVAPRG